MRSSQKMPNAFMTKNRFKWIQWLIRKRKETMPGSKHRDELTSPLKRNELQMKKSCVKRCRWQRWRICWINLFSQPKEETKKHLNYSDNSSCRSILRRFSEKALNSSEPGTAESREDARKRDPRRDWHAINRCGVRRNSHVSRIFMIYLLNVNLCPIFILCFDVWLSQCHF